MYLYGAGAHLQKPRLSALTENAGFTIAELILALGMMMIVMTAMISLATTLNRTYTTQTVAAGVQHVTRAGLDIMVRNIRMAGYNPRNTEAVGVVEASANAFRFNFDLNESGNIETNDDLGDKESPEDIKYLRNASNQLIRQIDGRANSNRSLVENVSGLTFKYLDKNENETANLNDIRVVEVSLTVEEPSGRGRPISRTYQTRVICRNLGL
jgi:type IV pilus assembly protein PilW